jgi:sulfoxide reductase heme-binding subunit YedZ
VNRSIDPVNHLWWIASRASGVVALVLVTVSVGIGLTMAAKVVRRRGLGPQLAAVHEQTALAGLIAIAVHGITLLGDPWLHPGIAGITVPFAMGYRTLFTGLGVLAGWIAALLGLSFYVRRWVGARLWRRLHRWTVVVYVLGLAHTLGAGTDAATPWLRSFMVLTAIPMAALLVVRILGPARRRRRAAPGSRRRSPSAAPRAASGRWQGPEAAEDPVQPARA